MSLWGGDVLGQVFPRVHSVVQNIFLSCSPAHLGAGETSGPVTSRVHCHHPTETFHSGLHVGQGWIAGCLCRLTWEQRAETHGLPHLHTCAHSVCYLAPCETGWVSLEWPSWLLRHSLLLTPHPPCCRRNRHSLAHARTTSHDPQVNSAIDLLVTIRRKNVFSQH